MPQVTDQNGATVPGVFAAKNGSGQVKAYTTSAAIDNVIGSDTRFVEVVVTTAAYVRVGVSPTAAIADRYVPANTPMIFPCAPGDKVAAVQVAAGGNLYVTELA
jgi:hypothetical protein